MPSNFSFENLTHCPTDSIGGENGQIYQSEDVIMI